jgi:hypothetical protein
MISKGILMIIIGILGSLISLFLFIRTLRKPLIVPEYHQDISESSNLAAKTAPREGESTKTLPVNNVAESLASETIELQPILKPGQHVIEETTELESNVQSFNESQTSVTQVLSTHHDETVSNEQQDEKSPRSTGETKILKTKAMRQDSGK